MNTPMTNTAARTQTTVLSTNKVIRNTYTLLSMTLLFSALTAGASMAWNLPHPGLLLTLGGYFGLLFATTRFRNSSLGIVFVFALTGFMGYTLGPILNAYLALPNGGQIVMTAMLQLHGRLSDGWHPGRLHGWSGRNIFRNCGHVTGGIRHVRTAHGRPDPLPDQ